MAVQSTVMTFNLRRSSWMDGRNAWPIRRQIAAEAILQSNADIIGTQEGSAHMLGELDALLEGYGRIGIGRDGGSNGEYCAIYYNRQRWLPAEHGTFWLSDSPELPGSRAWGAVFPRICTWAAFEAADETEARVAVYNVHLDHISGLARQRGAALAAARLRERHSRTGEPAFLLGDFNSKPHRPAVAQLSAPPYSLVNAYDTLHGGAASAGATYHAFRGGGEGRQPVDYIFATGDVRIGQVMVDRSRYGGRHPSDHYPIVVRATLP